MFGSVEKLGGDESTKTEAGSEACVGQTEDVGGSGRGRTSSLGNDKGASGSQVKNMIQKAKITSFGKQRRFRIESSDR